MSVCNAVQWVKLSETWPKLKFFDYHRMLKNLLEGQKKVPSATKVYVYDNWGGFVFGTGK
jgi:hypothetical protein